MKFSTIDQVLLKSVYAFARARKVKLYLVGGILRDILLGSEKENPDFDFCLKKGSIGFGRGLAGKMKAGFVVLDKEHGACRVVKKSKDKLYTFDFTDFRGKNLEGDLALRDFTINAICLPLEKVFSKESLDNCLIDPHNGRQDLKSKVIRAIYKNAFKDDALRILRAFSFSSSLRFEIEKDTLKSAASQKERLSSVSWERVRDELFKVFGLENVFDYLFMLDKMKVLGIIFPEIEDMRGVKQGPYHHLDILRHSLESVKQLELLIKQMRNNKDINLYLDEAISSGRRRRALIKLGAFLHDIGKPKAMRREKGKTIFHGHERIGARITENIARRLKLSNDELTALEKMVFWHLRPGYLGDYQSVSPRARFRYFRDTAREAVSTLLISLADQRSTRGPLTTEESRQQHEKICNRLIREYFRKQKEQKLARLINGNDLIRKFKLEPSPLIGRILSDIEELQAIGKIVTKKGALETAEKIIKRQSKPTGFGKR